MLVNSNRNPVEDLGFGPNQVWVVGFSILIMYLHLLFELRVIRSLGIFVNIIINITKKIMLFLILFTVLVIGFSHALLYSTHTHQVNCVPGSYGCDLSEGATKYPSGFFAAVAATYFFVAGRWDPLDEELDRPNDVAFHVIMIIFLVFTVILLLNVLIAIMNMAYEECQEEGEMAWLKQWSQVLDEIAHIFLTPWQKQTYLPDYVYYEATAKEVMSYTEENNLGNLDSNGIGSSVASKIEGGKYTFVALSREELSLTLGYSSMPGTLKKSPSPPSSQQQQQQPVPPASGSTLAPPSSITPSLEPATTAGEGYATAETVAASTEQEEPPEVIEVTDRGMKPVDSVSVQYEKYCDRYEVYHSRFDHILEEDFELLEETEDCTSDMHDHREHKEAREKLHAELKMMQTSVQELSQDMLHTLEQHQIPLERRARTGSTPSTEAEPSLTVLTAPALTVEPGPSSSKSSTSPLSGTTTLLPRPPVSSGERSDQDYFGTPSLATASSVRPEVELTLDMVRLRDLYFMSLDLEKNIQKELSPE
ncbi:hypothetical protein BGZ73_000895 [Actinomortierella ambigua]|nr:hypothetical protein BGZ73_000895 [Actinomortierella ambigua]